MYLTDVKIKNFRGYGENKAREDKCYIYSSLDAQLVVFHGFNGFGKTSFYEAIEWCLTDNVYRLNKFYDENTYGVNELKRSHFLKFYHPLDGTNRSRMIYVELLFNNGLSIVRTSTSTVLKTSDKDRSYSSNVLMGYDGNLVRVNNEKVLMEFIEDTKDRDTFFNTHMLGQESIGDFLRNNSPSKRRGIFMQLLQEEKLSSTLQTLKKLKSPNNKVSIKLKQLNIDLSERNNSKNGISDSFTKLGFKNEIEYLETIRATFKPIQELIKGNILSEELKLSLLADNEINLNNVADIFQNISIVNQNVLNNRISLITQMNELTRIREGRKKLGLLYKAEELLKLSLHAELLQRNNVVTMKQELLNIRAKQNEINGEIGKITNKKNELNKSETLFSSNINSLDFTDRTIKEAFWTDYRNDRNKLSEFNEGFSEFLRLQENQYTPIKTRTDQELSEMKSKDELYQREKNLLLHELEICSNTKKELSNLNAEYQNLLNTVKEYIATNEADVKECPVCLNNNFSNKRYEELFEEWDVETSAAGKLTSIIDLTFAKGNKQIDIISSKENELLGKINRLHGDYEKNILNTLKLEIEAARKTFREEYAFILSRLNTDIFNLNENNQKLGTRKNDLERTISSANESIQFLFGGQGNEEHINKEELDKHIVNFRDWLQQNQNELGMLHQPSLSDIQMGIEALKTQSSINVQEDDNLFINIQTNTQNRAFIEDLSKLLSDILNYNIPTEFAKLLGGYKELDEKIENLSKYINAITKAKESIDVQHDKLSDKQNRVIKQRLENHPIISWVYEAINPHPFHKKLHITNTGNGTNFIGQTQLDEKIDLYLDQIFSAAQLNILALSIFLGLGLSQSYSKLDQLFLDDPIQSMDDVNILAFIDVLRAIMDSSRYGHKKLIISTHDDNFAQLLSIKMRNKKTVQYHIIGYTEEGPIIKQM